ncbi:MAG: hypothetical protein OER91_09810 [Gammaproteobacteria bacterium]|nr:hypothetical protein [Gammaproteobacteria bacterium]
MEKEDKIAFSVILVILFVLMLAVKVVGSAIFGWFDAADAGVGFKDALIVAVILSVVLLVLFAVVAGDGVIGELPSMIIGFFLVTAFFTLSIAWIF